MTASRGENLLISGIGNDTVSVNYGPDTIQFVEDDVFSFSATVVKFFDEEEGDTIILFENTIDDFDDMIANHLRDRNGTAEIFHDNYTILLDGITVAELSDSGNGYADNFVF